jgi:hypothetical protein
VDRAAWRFPSRLNSTWLTMLKSVGRRRGVVVHVENQVSSPKTAGVLALPNLRAANQ